MHDQKPCVFLKDRWNAGNYTAISSRNSQKLSPWGCGGSSCVVFRSRIIPAILLAFSLKKPENKSNHSLRWAVSLPIGLPFCKLAIWNKNLCLSTKDKIWFRTGKNKLFVKIWSMILRELDTKERHSFRLKIPTDFPDVQRFIEKLPYWASWCNTSKPWQHWKTTKCCPLPEQLKKIALGA